jgi:transposase
MNKYIGIDVAKTTLQVYIPKINIDLEIENSPKAIKQLYAKLKKQYKEECQDLIFVYEPTGSYSTFLDRFSMDHSIRCFKVKPSQSSAFAKTLDHRNKSDKIDARLLHQMGAIAKAHQIEVPHIDEDAHKLQSLYKYLRRIIKERTALSNYLEAVVLHQEDPFVIKRLRSRLKAFKKEEEELIQQMLDFIKHNSKYQKEFENITSIKGIGPIAGLALFALFLRYPNASRKKITALCGLDPITKSSGTSVNTKGRISKQGNKAIRETLFMPVLISINYNTEFKTMFDRLKANGKHTTVAQIAIMRKLILLAYSLYKNNTKYDPERYLIYQQTKELAIRIKSDTIQ